MSNQKAVFVPREHEIYHRIAPYVSHSHRRRKRVTWIIFDHVTRILKQILKNVIIMQYAKRYEIWKKSDKYSR
jgi:hypothetical protein